jgi:predicted nucleic acid-binding protein
MSPARRARQVRRASAAGRRTTPGGLTVLVDTNIILDVVLAREPWVDDATRLLDAIAQGQARGWVAGHAVTTVYYVVDQARGRTAAVTAISDLLEILPVVPLASDDFRRALSLGLRDYEDAVQAAACLQVGAQFLVTRNARDFRGAPVTARSAGEVCALLGGPPLPTE